MTTGTEPRIKATRTIPAAEPVPEPVRITPTPASMSGKYPWPTPRAELVRDVVAFGMGITLEELFTKNRHPTLVVARELITHLCRIHTRLSYPEIARLIGRPNHSTIITAHKRFAVRVGASPKLTPIIGGRLVKWRGVEMDILDAMKRAEVDIGPVYPARQAEGN